MSEKPEMTPDRQVLHVIDAAASLQEVGEVVKAIDLLLHAQQLAPYYAPVHMLLGLAYREAGRLEESEATLHRALELDPEQPPALQGLGLLLAEKGQRDEAIELLRRHLALRKGDPLTLQALSNQLYLAGQGEEGLALLREAWEQTKTEGSGVRLGRYLIRLRRPREAEGVFGRVVEVANAPGPLLEWAYSLIDLRRIGEAIVPLRRVTEIEPSRVSAWRALANCQIVLSEYHEALNAAERALALDAQDPRNWWPKASSLLSLGRWDEAVMAARLGSRCLAARPADRHLLAELVLVETEALLRLGRPEEALQRLDEIDPEIARMPASVLARADALNHLGRPAEALFLLDEAEATGMRRDNGAVAIRYESLHLLGESSDAERLTEPWIAQDPSTRINLLSDVGVALYQAGHIDAARSAFRQLAACTPGLARPTANMGFILLGDGDLSSARTLFDRAFELPDHELIDNVLHANLGYLTLVDKDYAAAEHHLQAAVAHSGGQKEQAILHVAYWHDGQVAPDPIAHPRSFGPLHAFVAANRVTLALAQGQQADALTLARLLMKEHPGLWLSHAMVGWADQETGRPADAREAWGQARLLAKEPIEQAVIEGWLTSIPD